MEIWVTAAACLCAAGRTLKESFGRLLEGTCPPPTPPKKLLKLAQGLAGAPPAHPAFSLPDGCFPDGFRHSAKDGLALEEAVLAEALEQAGLSPADLSHDFCGLVMGATAGNALHFLDDYAQLRNGDSSRGQAVRDFFEANPAQALADKLALKGPAMTVGNACCSGTDAIGLAGELIRSGRCLKVLAGGADALSLVPYLGFRRLMIYSQETCRPFDRQRRGLNLGEGAAMLILEEAEAARARGARPLARLLAYSAASDAHHLTAPHPQAQGLRRAIRQALAQAGLSPAELAFVNAHGTATKDNDRSEALAFRNEIDGVPVWATKGATGHTLGAAGAIEAALTVAALHAECLPASPGFKETDPELGLSPTQAAGELRAAAAMSVSLGFGGGNSVLIFGKERK